MNSETMVMWLRAMVQAAPHGGKAKAAKKLGLSGSGLSKLLNNPARGFDEKTLNAVAWVQSSKAHLYSYETYPMVASVTIGPIVIETRTHSTNRDVEFQTWRLAAPEAEQPGVQPPKE
jgi:hypothetical protein